MVKPLIPIFCDVWAHEFNEIEHISTVHAKYGSNHIQKEIAETDSDTNKKNQNSLKYEDQVAFHISTNEISIDFHADGLNKKIPLLNLNKLSNAFIPKHIPPPKFS